MANRQGWFRPELEGHPESLEPPGLIEKRPRSAELPARKPCLLITATMIDSASVRSLPEALLPRSDCALFLVGWHHPRSAAGQLQVGVKTVRCGERDITCRAAVHDYRCFSGHGDAADIDRWLTRQPRSAALILTHGEPDALQSRAADLKAKGWRNVTVAKEGLVLHFPLPQATANQDQGCGGARVLAP